MAESCTGREDRQLMRRGTRVGKRRCMDMTSRKEVLASMLRHISLTAMSQVLLLSSVSPSCHAIETCYMEMRLVVVLMVVIVRKVGMIMVVVIIKVVMMIVMRVIIRAMMMTLTFQIINIL